MKVKTDLFNKDVLIVTPLKATSNILAYTNFIGRAIFTSPFKMGKNFTALHYKFSSDADKYKDKRGKVGSGLDLTFYPNGDIGVMVFKK